MSNLKEKNIPTKKSKKNTPHDGLIKKVMENPIAAREFLEEYLPPELKAKLDLTTVKAEKESFVEKHLTKQLSDIVLSVKTTEGNNAFVYCLIEAQIEPDYWMAFRLWKYTLLLCERHTKDKGKLPLVYPIVLYHGTRKYNAPKSLWELFDDHTMAKNLLTNDYPLVDLQAMSDNDINYDRHLSMILYLLKHIHQRDTLKLIEDIFKQCHKAILIDQKQDYLYTKFMVWYLDSKIPLKNKQQVEQIVMNNLPKEDTEDIMKTIAQAYIEEGEARGKAKGIEIVAKNLLKAGLSSDMIASSTGLTLEQIDKLSH